MRIIDPDAGTDVVQGTDVPPDSLLTALDALVARVRGRLPVRARRAAPPLPDVATRSLPALAAYAAAVRHQEDLRYTAALAGYREAIALDSSFAVAYAALGNLLHVLNRPLAGDSALRQAMARLDGVPPHDRVRIQATAAVARSQYEVAIGALLGWLSQHPEDRPLRARLANVYMRAGNLEASAREWRRIVAEDSLDADAWIDLSKAVGHHPATLDSAALERGLAIQPRRLDDVFTVQSLGNVLVLSGRPDSAASVFRRLTTRDSSLAGRGYRWLGMLALWQGTPTLAAAELARAIDRQQREPLSTLRTLWVSVHANQMRGDTAATRRALDALAAVAVHPEVAEPRALWFAGTLLARAGRVRDAQRVLDHLRSRMLKEVRPHQASERLLGAEIAGARGEFRTALALAREGAGYDRFILSLEGLALAHLRVGAPDSAVAALRMIEQEIPSFSWEGSVIRRFVGAPLATSLLAAGDTLGARQVRDALRRQLPKAEPAALAWVAGTGFLGLPATSGRPAP
jgi:tetratricopeptide (TPR) repeat protein